MSVLRFGYPDTVVATRMASLLLDPSYPQCEPQVLSDNDFDALVAKLLAKKS